MKEKTSELTPLMNQYASIKSQYPDAILLFRVGDFYETFGEDAIKTSSILNIALTSRNNGSSDVPLAGFPYHALDVYLPKLVRAGQRVAICEQLEDPKFAKTIVKRGVTEIITPGTATTENIINNKDNNFLAAVYINKNILGIAFLDISTGEFLATEGNKDYIERLIQSFNPKEILYERSKHEFFFNWLGNKFYLYKLDDWLFNYNTSITRLCKHFNTTTLRSFGIGEMTNAIIAAGAIFQYLDLTQHERLSHISKISPIPNENYMWLDKFTIKNLEIIYSPNENATTLIDVIDKTATPMGSRLLKRWITFPLIDINQINNRLNFVEFFYKNSFIIDEILPLLKPIGDLGRLISKISIGKANPRDILQLSLALENIKKIKALFNKNDIIYNLSSQLNPCEQLIDLIKKTIKPDCSLVVGKGDVIQEGVSQKLDEYRFILINNKKYLQELQNKEILKTGISSLKISFNNVFGYYIEVRNTHKDKVPPHWIRKQTLVNAERYITPELKEYEEKILIAEEEISKLENELFQNLISEVLKYIQTLQLNAEIIAQLDCYQSAAKVALENNYTRPEINDSLIIDLKDSRHPVIEKQLPPEVPFVPNDIYIDPSSQQILIITGPNMSGKSAILRQTALIVILAQAGLFVPAKEAKIGMVDRIFTRVGASDNITQGESTFMVEMIETALILNNLSERSLILLDEIGRGTSTYDGISIAWAIAEYLHEYPYGKPRTLFATHYHELNEMEKQYKNIKNYHVSVKEIDDKIIFLHKLMPGGTEHSFGIHVAEMAGLPKSIIKRSKEILKQLEAVDANQKLSRHVSNINKNREGYQLTIFQLDDPTLSEIKKRIEKIDINKITPIEAINILYELKKITGY
ncbi:MAG: DNA mismatch repair protein MutS [Bacteroidales bacterium]|nr:DNA mismatch repair protein MutS [Bacteroidales bacterium]